MKATFRSLAVALLTLLQASAALSDAPLIWGPSNTARLLNSGELVGKNGDIYLHSPVALTFPAANAKGPLLNDGSGTLSWLVGNNNSFTGFDSTGTMISIPGYSWDQTTSALNGNLTVDPFVSSYTLYGFNTQANPTADTVNAVTTGQFSNSCGTDNSGFACGDPITGAGGLYGINNSVNSSNKSPAGHLQQYNGYSQIGNGVDPITVHDIGGIANGQTLASGVTLNYVSQIINNLQAPVGSKLNTYTGLAEYSNINHLLQNYNGIQNSATIATLDGYYTGFQDSSQVTTANSSYTSYQVSPGISTLRGSYNGVNISPNITNAALTAEQFEITTVADVAQSLAGKYLTFCDPNTDGGTCWAPWFKVSGTGTAPVLSGYTLIEVDINTNDSASVVGTTLYTAVNALTVNLTWVDSGTGIVTGTAINAGGSQQAQAEDSGFAVVMLVFGGGDGQAYGLNINMGNTTGFAAGNVNAITATGDVSVDGKLQTSVNAPMADQGGASANPVNTINTEFTIAPGITVNNADEFGFGPIANLTLGANAHLNASPGLQVGASSLGMIGLIQMDNLSTATNVNGSFIAQVLVGGTGAGGIIDDMAGYRAISANFGSPSTVTNYRAYFADDLLGAPATNSWGLYSKSSFENYMGKSLKIGGAPVTGDKVANSSVGLQVTDTAIYPDPITTAARNALTPLTGMLVNNSDTAQLERYDGATWVGISGGGTVTSIDVSGGTTGLTTSGGPVTGSGTITLSGTLGVANGGTGAATLALNNVLLGNATSALQEIAPGTSGNVLTSDGTTWASSPATGGTALNALQVGVGNSTTPGQTDAVSTLLVGDVTAASDFLTATITIANPAVVTATAHGQGFGAKVFFTTTGALPTGLVINTTYFVAGTINANDFQLAATYADAINGNLITTTGTQSGVHTLHTGGLTLTPGELRGLRSGSAIGAGYVGEVGTQTFSNVTLTTTYSALATGLDLTPGNWTLYGQATSIGCGVTTSAIDLSIDTTNGGTGTTGISRVFGATRTSGYGQAVIAVYTVNIGTTTTYYLNGASDVGSCTGTYGNITAIRR
jgi:hypothetical protein